MFVAQVVTPNASPIVEEAGREGVLVALVVVSVRQVPRVKEGACR